MHLNDKNVIVHEHFRRLSYRHFFLTQDFTQNISFSKDITSEFERCGALKIPNYIINREDNDFLKIF